MSVRVRAPRPVVWSIVSDVDGWEETISAIERVEVLERPTQGIRGLRWRETRTMHGKRATETMWITEVEEGSAYVAEAQSHGSAYRTRVALSGGPGETRLAMEFTARPLTLPARMVWLAFGWLIARSVRAALRKDLEEIADAAEARGAAPPGA